MAVVTTLTPYATDDPSPRVDVVMTGFDAAVSTATIYQISSAGQMTVRGAVRIPAAGGVVVTDYEVPLNRETTYRAETFNSGGTSLGFVGDAVTTVTINTHDIIVQDPLAPNNAVRVRGEFGFSESLEYNRDVQLHRRGNDTIALMGRIGLLENINLSVYTDSADQVETMLNILREGTILVRTTPEKPTPAQTYAVVGAPVGQPFDVINGGTLYRWPITGMQITRSDIGVIVATVTYQRYIDYYATYSAFNAAYPTYLDALKNPPPEA